MADFTICDEYKIPDMIEGWQWCVNASRNESFLAEMSIEDTRDFTGNFSCTAFFQQYTSYKPVMQRVVIPLLCLFGIIGNGLNILVLTRGKLLRVLDAMERSAIYGLTALAVSDLMFCVGVLPVAIIKEQSVVMLYASKAFSLYYRLYSVGAINCFVLISSWLIVIIAINRLIAVVYPIQARYWINETSTVIGLLVVFFFGVLVTMPFFLLRRIQYCSSPEGVHMVEAVARNDPRTHYTIIIYLVYIWPVLCHFIPFTILLTCNIGIIITLNRAANGMPRREFSTNHKTASNVNTKVTLTLIAIIFMYFILVFPGEIFKYVDPLVMNETHFIIIEIFNLLQTINFTCNFVLYCLVNPTFRTTAKALLTRCYRREESRTSTSRFTEVQTKSTNKTTLRPLPKTTVSRQYHF